LRSEATQPLFPMRVARPSLGSLLLRFRQKYKHGVMAAYYRDRVRPRILATRPMECGSREVCEIHVLTSSADWLNLVWTLKSFFYYSGQRNALCIHDDGSLGPQATATLLDHFPGARVIGREQADDQVGRSLRHFPRCLQFRRSNHLAPKVFDFAYYLTSDRMLLIDSDILFFSRPDELLHRIGDANYRLNSVNADVRSAYTTNADDAKARCGIELQPRFNSGLGLIHRQSLRLDWIEEFLSLPGILSHFWRIEQTIYALCSSRFGVELLPEEYAVRLDAGVRNAPCRHYVGVIRHLMYREGMRHLRNRGLLKTVQSTY
jgi:hypothetical protein